MASLADLIELIVVQFADNELVKDYLEACERTRTSPEAIAYRRIVEAADKSERAMIATLASKLNRNTGKIVLPKMRPSTSPPPNNP